MRARWIRSAGTPLAGARVHGLERACELTLSKHWKGLTTVLIWAIACVAVSTARAADADRQIVFKETDLRVAPPAGTIYWSVDRGGRVVLSDRPDPGAPRQIAGHYQPYTDPDAMQRAQREREFWQAQARALDERQRDRDREQEMWRRQREIAFERELAASHGYGSYWGDPAIAWRVVRGAVPLPSQPAPASQAVFAPSQSAAPGQGAAPFLSSGFASGLRR